MSTIIGGSSPSVTFPDSTVQNTAGLPLSGGTLSGALTVPTLNAPSGVLATQNGMTGIAKAWVNFNGSTQAIANSFNVSSITRNSTGNYTINFSTAMPSSSYSTCGLATTIGGTDPSSVRLSTQSTGSQIILTGFAYSTGSWIQGDYTLITISVFA